MIDVAVITSKDVHTTYKNKTSKQNNATSNVGAKINKRWYNYIAKSVEQYVPLEIKIKIGKAWDTYSQYVRK